VARTFRNIRDQIEIEDGVATLRNADARRLTHHSTRRTELRAADAIREADFVVRNRVRGRASGGALPDYHDDRKVSAWFEVNYRNGAFDRRVAHGTVL
jgi:hypothetical protein